MLAERARNGDAAAYERLVRLHGAVAFRAAYVIRQTRPKRRMPPRRRS